MPPRKPRRGVRVDRGEELTVIQLDPRTLLDFRRYQTLTGPDGKQYEFITALTFQSAALVRRIQPGAKL